MLRGVLGVISACLMWGLIFVIPGFLNGFSSIELAIGRCLSFGTFAVAILVARKRYLFKEMSREVWKKAFIFSFLASGVHYFTLVLGLRYANVAITTLIIGTTPVCVAIYGNMRQKEFAFKPLIIPCSLLAIGLTLVNLPPFLQAESPTNINEYLLGIFFGLISLASWVWVAVSNSEFLKKNPNIRSSDWVTILGVSTFLWATFLVMIGLLFFVTEQQLDKYINPSPELSSFLVGCMILGWGCSWLGSYLWNYAAIRLPISLLGQLTIFETLFALTFLTMIEARLPEVLEITGIIIALIGITTNVYVMRSSYTNKKSDATVELAN